MMYDEKDYNTTAATIITCGGNSITDPHYGNATSNIEDICSTTE